LVGGIVMVMMMMVVVVVVLVGQHRVGHPLPRIPGTGTPRTPGTGTPRIPGSRIRSETARPAQTPRFGAEGQDHDHDEHYDGDNDEDHYPLMHVTRMIIVKPTGNPRAVDPRR
jgi:hypothetical protein